MAVTDVSTSTTNVSTDRDTKQLLVERVFNAPRELVWKAFTESDRLEQWWGPRGWHTRNKAFEATPGGTWHYCMTGPDGTESWGKGVFKELDAPSRLSYLDVFSDAQGNDMPDMPVMQITVEFFDEGGKTRVRSVSEFSSIEALEAVLEMGVVDGLSQTWDRLEEYLASA